MRKLITSAVVLAAFMATPVVCAENIYLYKDGKVVFTENTDNIGRLAYEDNNSSIAIYGSDGKSLFKAAIADIDYLSSKHEAPVADLLDVEFKDNGSAEDLSPMKMRVRATNKAGISTYYNKNFGRNAVSFSNAWGGTVSGNYRVDYSTNTAFRNALADGHTLEVVVMANFDGLLSSTSNNKEAKCFASHQAGGTGIMVCTTSRGSSGQNEFTFLPCVGSYRWATAGTAPEKGVFYHIVGVWDKEEGRAKLFVNGNLVSNVAASGAYTEPSAKSLWFCIGGDASDSTPSNGWKGDVVIARVYDDPLTAAQVKALWTDVETGCSVRNDNIVDDMTVYSLPVRAGGYYPIRGSQFAEGDSFISESDNATYTFPASIFSGEARVTLPADFAAGSYNISLVRGEKTQNMGRATLSVVEAMPKAAGTIAHRGLWNAPGSAQNSRESLRLAQELGVYGSETDIWITTDGGLYVNHDPSFSGVTIENATSEQCARLKLSNGETMPTLSDFITMIKESDSPTKLIIEIKGHSTKERNKACAAAAVKAVKEAGVADKVEYISFSLDALEGVLESDPEAICAYLGSNMTPQRCYELGHKSIDFTYSTYKSSKKYITQAHELGMTVNAWTFSAAQEMIEATTLGIDLLTTDSPEDAMYIGEYFQSNQ